MPAVLRHSRPAKLTQQAEAMRTTAAVAPLFKALADLPEDASIAKIKTAFEALDKAFKDTGAHAADLRGTRNNVGNKLITTKLNKYIAKQLAISAASIEKSRRKLAELLARLQARSKPALRVPMGMGLGSGSRFA